MENEKTRKLPYTDSYNVVSNEDHFYRAFGAQVLFNPTAMCASSSPLIYWEKDYGLKIVNEWENTYRIILAFQWHEVKAEHISATFSPSSPASSSAFIGRSGLSLSVSLSCSFTAYSLTDRVQCSIESWSDVWTKRRTHKSSEQKSKASSPTYGKQDRERPNERTRQIHTRTAHTNTHACVRSPADRDR